MFLIMVGGLSELMRGWPMSPAMWGCLGCAEENNEDFSNMPSNSAAANWSISGENGCCCGLVLSDSIVWFGLAWLGLVFSCRDRSWL